jgi:hypothetical protein
MCFHCFSGWLIITKHTCIRAFHYPFCIGLLPLIIISPGVKVKSGRAVFKKNSSLLPILPDHWMLIFHLHIE